MMAGHARFELMSSSLETSFTGNYSSGQRGYSTPALDRSSSFRESSDSRNFSSGKANSRGSATTSGDATSLSQCLMLEPITIGDPKHARSGDLRRILDFSVGSSLEDNSFGAAHLKNSSSGAVEELKRLRASVADTWVKASGRAKKLDDHLNKLNKYCETMSSKKQQQRNEMPTNDRSCGPTLKIGSLMHQNPTDLFGSQKFDDRPKNGGLNKRLRTSVAETRAECRNGVTQRQPLTVTRERDLHKDNDADSDIVEGKIRRLPGAGEGWDKKMKRTRSVGAVFSRSIDNDGEIKRTLHHKLPGESSLQSSDSTPSFRPGASGSTNKLDPASSAAASGARNTALKNEQEKSTLSRDLTSRPTKERTLGKVNVRMGNREDSNAVCPSPIVKLKASRAPRSSSMVAASSASNVPHVSVTLESWEQPQSVNKAPTIGGASNQKRSTPSGSSPPITQWVGQRPQKILRTRRTNLIPVSSHEDVQMQSEGCPASDSSPRNGTYAAVPTKSSASGTPLFKAKPENAPSPARLSESEESGAGEIRMQDKGLGSGDGEKVTIADQNVGHAAIPIKKNKIMVKDDNGDGVRRQGRSGRTSPFSRASTSPTREKLDNVGSTKPQRNARSGSEKNGSKSGRPLKKLSDRKGFSRLGHIANWGSPDCSGESEDDRKELVSAANLACYSSVNACSSLFWKSVEFMFANVGADEESFLLEQIKLAEETCTNSYQNYGNENHVQMKMDDYGHDDNEALDRMEYAEQQQTSLIGSSETENQYGSVASIYQRLMSAFIIVDEIEEPKETHVDLGEQAYGSQTPKTCNGQVVFPCNGNADPSALRNGGLQQRDGGYVHSEVEMLVKLSRCDNGVQSLQTDDCDFSSSGYTQYEQTRVEQNILLELESIGISVEPPVQHTHPHIYEARVPDASKTQNIGHGHARQPDLDDKDEDEIHMEIVQLQKRLHEQTRKKKSCLENLYKAIQESKNIGRRYLEQVAMDKLVELAYKKMLATRGSFASKQGIPKVSKQAALAFAKLTLARCRKFEESGTSCFTDPALRDLIFATPPKFDEAELLAYTTLSSANDPFDPPTFARNGPISNRSKRKEVFLDDVGGAILRGSSALGILDSAKGKRSDRGNVVKVGRPAMGERKAKSKPKQKMSSVDNKPLTDTTCNNAVVRKDVRFMSTSNGPPLSMDVKEFADLPIDGIDELVVDSKSGEPQDLNSWFDFDVDGLHDQDLVGLEIPMDDLAELNMFPVT